MTYTRIPICDVAALRSGSARQQARIVLDIGAAARETGFFTIVNHGVPGDLSEAAFATAQRFFALPEAEKELLSMDRTSQNRGYSRLRGERGDGARPAGLRESFSIGPDSVGGDSNDVPLSSFAGPNGWPPLPGFRDTAMGYFRALNGLAVLVQRAFALDLSMPPDFFVPHSDRPLTTLHFLRYPAQPAAPGRGEPGPGVHDGGIFTLLAQDAAGGLEVQHADGSWSTIEPVPNAFVCYVGDCLMRWSNDRYVARAHRVVERAGGDHLAIAFFADPSPDTLIACLPTCHDEDHPPKYPPISYAAYRQERSHASMVTAAV